MAEGTFGGPKFEVDQAFWSGKRVFLTGHNGFMWGGCAAWKHEAGEAHLKEAGLLLLDSSLAQRNLGWGQMSDLFAGLEAAAAWYRAAVELACSSALAALTRARITDLAGTPFPTELPRPGRG